MEAAMVKLSASAPREWLLAFADLVVRPLPHLPPTRRPQPARALQPTWVTKSY